MRFFAIHHTGTEDGPNPVATVQSVYRFHAVERGWGDIGYNFVIDADGVVYEGRFGADGGVIGENSQGHGVVGGHTFGHNRGSVGIAILATLHDREPTRPALDALIELLVWKATSHGVDPLGVVHSGERAQGGERPHFTIVGHGDLRPTTCPGARLRALLPAIRREVANRMPPRLSAGCRP